MGNYISFRRWRAINDDEESAGLVPEALSQAQEKALVHANEELRSCNAELQSSREEAVTLRERLRDTEKERHAMESKQVEQAAALEAVKNELTVSSEALKAATEEASTLEKAHQQTVQDHKAADLAKRERIVELKRELREKNDDLCAQKFAHDYIVRQNEATEEVLALVEAETKVFEQETLALSERLFWNGRNFGQHFPVGKDEFTNAERWRKASQIKPKQPALRSLHSARNRLAREIWILGWVGEQYFCETEKLRCLLRSPLEVTDDKCRASEAEVAAHKVKSSELASPQKRNQGLTEQLAGSRPRFATLEHESQSTLASEPSDRTYSEAYRFSETVDKDLRVGIGWWQGELRVDVREFYSRRQSRKGVSIPVQDASRLAQVLPDVVRKASGLLQ